MDNVILQFLNKNNIFYQIIEHTSISTMQHTTQIPGLSLQEGAKSLLLKTKNEYILIVLRGDKKLNSKKLKKLLKIKDLRFATPEEVKNIMKCEIGSCFPFGNLIDIQMIVDKTLQDNELISFTPGVHTKSIKMYWKDYHKIIKPEIMSITL